MTLSTTNKVNKSVFHKLTLKGVCRWGHAWSLGRESQQGFGKAGGEGRRRTRNRQVPGAQRGGFSYVWGVTGGAREMGRPLHLLCMELYSEAQLLISVEIVQEEGKHAQGQPQRLTPNTGSSAEG